MVENCRVNDCQKRLLVAALQAVADFMRKDVQSGDSDLWTPEYETLHDDVIVALHHARVGSPQQSGDK